MGFAVRNSHHRYHRPGGSIHFGGLEGGNEPSGSFDNHHNGVPPAGKWVGGTFSPHTEECASVRSQVEWFMDEVAPMGAVGTKKCAKAGHGDIDGRGCLRYLVTCTWVVFPGEQSPRHSSPEQLELARANVRSFLPNTPDLRKFKESPFVAKSLRMASFVYIRDDRLGKPSLAPRYTEPYKVLEKDWGNNTFLVDVGSRQDTVSLSRLKAATVQTEAT